MTMQNEQELIAQITWTRKDLAEAIRQQGGDPNLAYTAFSPDAAADLARRLEEEAIRSCCFAMEDAAHNIIDDAPAPAPPALRKIEDLEAVLEAHAIWTLGKPGGCRADLSYADLSDLDLRDVQLGGAVLTGANFARTDMRGANISEAKANGAVFDHADTTKMFAARTDFSDASFVDTKMDRMYLKGAVLDEAIFKDVSMTSCDLREVKADAAIFERVDMAHSNGDLAFLEDAFCNGVIHPETEMALQKPPSLRDEAAAAKDASKKLANGQPVHNARREER